MGWRGREKKEEDAKSKMLQKTRDIARRGCADKEKEKRGREEKDHVAITVQFVQLTFIMSPSDGVDRAGERLRA